MRSKFKLNSENSKSKQNFIMGNLGIFRIGVTRSGFRDSSPVTLVHHVYKVMIMMRIIFTLRPAEVSLLTVEALPIC